MKHQTYYITIEQDEDGLFVAKCPDLPGCHTQAKNYEQAISRIKEAIELYLEVLADKKQAISQSYLPKFFAWQEIKAPLPA